MISPQRSVTFKLSAPLVTRSQAFSGEYASLADIATFVRQAAADTGLGDFAVYMVETAVDEACANIIEHAYGGEGQGDILITCQVHPDRLVIVLNDHGKVFNPDDVPEPDIHADLEDQPGHGMGLYFIRKWMDEVSYTSSPQTGNVLTMIKRKENKG